MKMMLERHPASLLACLLLLNCLALSPLLITGFIADDILNSQIRGHMLQTDRSLWGVTVYYAMNWLRNEGRLFPLAFYGYSVFYLLTNVFLYKVFVMGVILASISSFFVFIRRLIKSELIPTIAVLLLSMMFQFRASWDPILAFNAAYPLICLLLFCSLNLFLRAMDEGNRRALWWAVFLFLCGGLIFEVTYLMCLVYGGVAYLRLRNVKSAARASWPFFAVTTCLAMASVILRTLATAQSSTYRMNLNMGIIIKTYFVQLFGAVPFSYFLFDPHAVFTNRLSVWPSVLVQMLSLVLLLAAFTVLALRQRLQVNVRSENTRDRMGILAIGALLLTIPACLISLSPKFQAQTWGDAYLPVYLTYFGLSLLLAVGLEQLYWRGIRLPTCGGWIAPAAVCIWLLLWGFNFRNNWIVAQVMNEAVWNPRVLAEEALDRGLLTGLSPKAVLLVSGIDPWDNADEYSQHTGIRYSVYKLNESRNLTPVFQAAGGICATAADLEVCDFANDAPVYTVQIRYLTDGTGAILLARIQKAYQSGGFVRGLLTSDVTAYFHLPASPHPLGVAVSGKNMQEKSSVSNFRANDRQLQVVKQGQGWKVVTLRANTVLDALSLRGEIIAERPGSSIVAAKSRDAFELHATGPELLHVGYESADLGIGPVFPPINFENEMSIEVLVVPGDSQSAWADILSNHWVDSRGFAIEQVNSQTNQYSASFGTGKGWTEIGTFTLTKGRRNYISLQIKDREARLAVNGNPVARKILAETIPASPHSVHIGNWKGRDREFNGWIQEVLIAKGAKSDEVMLADATRLGAAYMPGESQKPLVLKGSEVALVHMALDTEGSQSIILPNTAPLPDTFTLELLVRPANTQTPYATIISNHPGKKGFEGFTIEQAYIRTNYYVLGFGNGKEWMPVGDFSISPGDLHYLAITKDKRQVSMYLDGLPIAAKLLGADSATSEYPLTVGNWHSKARPFNGLIQEVRITRTAASAKTIANKMGALKRATAH